MTGRTFPVIEIFGPTIQGEGIMAGKPTYFVRFGLCDFRCAWCDSGYAVLPEVVNKTARKITANQIVDEIAHLDPGPGWVTLSGGNPAMHDLNDLVVLLHHLKFKVAVETQGSIWREWLRDVDQLTVSPKPPSSTMQSKSYQTLPKFLENHPRCVLKVPVLNEIDYEWAVLLHEKYPDIPFYFSVVTLMGGLDGQFQGGVKDTRDSLLDRFRWLAELVAQDSRVSGATVLPQLHALLWGHGRGF